MAREFSRTIRVAENIRRALAPLVSAAVVESGIKMVSVTAVDVSPDLRQARVFVSLYCDETRRAEVIANLNAGSGRLRHQLAAAVRMKRMPALTFVHDDTMERGARISRLIDGEKDDDPGGTKA